MWVQNVRSSCKKNKNHSACRTITRVLEVKLYVLRQQYTNYQDSKYGSVTIKCLLMWQAQTPLLFVKVLGYHLFLVTICRKQCRALWNRALSEEVPHFDLKWDHSSVHFKTTMSNTPAHIYYGSEHPQIMNKHPKTWTSNLQDYWHTAIIFNPKHPDFFQILSTFSSCIILFTW